MKAVRATLAVQFYAELPENDADADDAFDAIGDEIADLLNGREIAYTVRESFSIIDGTTEPAE